MVINAEPDNTCSDLVGNRRSFLLLFSFRREFRTNCIFFFLYYIKMGFNTPNGFFFFFNRLKHTDTKNSNCGGIQFLAIFLRDAGKNNTRTRVRGS